MDPDRILNLSKYHRKTLIGFMVLLFILLLALDVWVKPNALAELAEMASDYIRAIASSILTALVVLWIVKSFLPPLSAKGLNEIQPEQITKEFDLLLATATSWRYKGNFGRYLRNKVLTSLENRMNMHISVCIIDPKNDHLCAEHAVYRGRIHAIDKGRKYDANLVATEALVTIIFCAWHVAHKKSKIDLYLTSVFDPVRIDANDNAMILTVEDRRQPALKVTKEHFSYAHFDSQLKFTREQARPLDLVGLKASTSISTLTSKDIIDFCERINMKELCERLTAKSILKACKESKNPYES
ncbi:hypothetical protein Meth11DRAFT_2001 [Methylophilaceae bacterium 11]|nr:hypothetical protein Meth11DRAFT_2001 [Methylophilaceae bacterium 11]